jgi:hypothetical protein
VTFFMLHGSVVDISFAVKPCGCGDVGSSKARSWSYWSSYMPPSACTAVCTVQCECIGAVNGWFQPRSMCAVLYQLCKFQSISMDVCKWLQLCSHSTNAGRCLECCSSIHV